MEFKRYKTDNIYYAENGKNWYISNVPKDSTILEDKKEFTTVFCILVSKDKTIHDAVLKFVSKYKDWLKGPDFAFQVANK